MAGYTMDGYTDLEALVSDLDAQSPTFDRFHRSSSIHVAMVLRALLARLPEKGTLLERGVELLSACEGMVQCAEADDLI